MIIKNITQWFHDLAHVWVRECWLVLHDKGAIIFFFVLCAIYPLLYATIYNPEVVTDVTVVVVDDDRSQESRELCRQLDATPEVCVVAYAADMQEARRMMNEKRCYGIVHVPREYSTSLSRIEKANVDVYCDMGVLLRYKQIVTAVTNVQQNLTGEIQAAKMAAVTTPGAIIESEQVPLGNTAMGLASAVLPCILMLVLQQSMLLGIGTLHGGSRERRLANRGYDPMEVPAGVTSTVIGKALCYVFMYSIPMVYVLYLVPMFFDFPQNGRLLEVLTFTIPFLLASAMLGQVLKIFVNDRESAFIALAFTSVIFVFLTGISWPRCAMNSFWLAIGNMIPSTWAANGYISLQTGGATLRQVEINYWMLWLLVILYFVLACIVEYYLCRPRWRRMRHYAKRDAGALMREEYRRQAVDILE